ncbi:FapA family protein [Ruminococcaceae bacterium OttesenSCG-928-D13]|nr:FapA family protein [Ruminococcaceae bacterium OttesenSCG-928-D13]
MQEIDLSQFAAPPSVGDAPDAVESIDALPHLFFFDNDMRAEMRVDAPVGEGRDVTIEDLKDLMMRKNVTAGVDTAALERLAAPLYGEQLVIATGQIPVNGVDGTCTELFPREVEKQMAERADGSVDYRELNLVRDIKAGTVLCDITLPTDGVPGFTVRGEKLKVTDGVKAVIPAGDNTKLSEDGLRLEATTQGNLVFRDGRFSVDTVIRVNNVDFDTGNISFSGDVQINGDVMDGFEVMAGGNVTLRGQAGAVKISAGQDLIVEKGMNGQGKALLEAGRNFKAGFIENCSLVVGEKLQAQSLINCQVECEGDVEVSSGKGIICGGKITTMGSVKAKQVGNDNNLLTVIVLGMAPRMIAERKRLGDQLEDVKRHLEELKKNVDYVERLVKDGRPVPPDRIQMLKRAQIQMPMTEKKREQLEENLNELEAKMMDTSGSTLTASTIHPPTKISIGVLSTNVIETRQSVRVYKSQEGEITFGKG